MKFKYNNGGSKFKNRNDCVIRAISIATNQDYIKILNEFKLLMDKQQYKGDPKKIKKKYLKENDWKRTSNMNSGTVTRVNLKENK